MNPAQMTAAFTMKSAEVTTEQLDELLAMASEAGACAVHLAVAEREHFNARQGQKAGPARRVREARQALARATNQMERARGRLAWE